MLKLTIPYFSFRYDISFLLTKQSVLHNIHWRIAFYFHIAFSLIVLFTGAFQFIKVDSMRIKKVHRSLGKIYVFTVLIVSAPSGLIMAFYANGGIIAKISFVITAILWWIFTFRAFRFIIKKEIALHQKNMLRSYALTLSAITLRIYVLVLPYFIHLYGKEMYATVAWLSWIPNLIVTETLICNKKRKY